jgi:hypothetical protein
MQSIAKRGCTDAAAWLATGLRRTNKRLTVPSTSSSGLPRRLSICKMEPDYPSHFSAIQKTLHLVAY